MLAYGALALVVTASLVVIAAAAIYGNFIYPNQAVAWVNGHGISRHDRTVLTNYFTAVENAASQQGNTQNLGDPETLAVAQLQKNLLATVNARQQFGIGVGMADARAKLTKDLAAGGTSMAADSRPR